MSAKISLNVTHFLPGCIKTFCQPQTWFARSHRKARLTFIKMLKYWERIKKILKKIANFNSRLYYISGVLNTPLLCNKWWCYKIYLCTLCVYLFIGYDVVSTQYKHVMQYAYENIAGNVHYFWGLSLSHPVIFSETCTNIKWSK